MKKFISIVIFVILTLNSAQASGGLPKGKSVPLTDSLLNAKIDSSNAVKMLTDRIQVVENAQNENTVTSSNDNLNGALPFGLIAITILNTICIIVLIIKQKGLCSELNMLKNTLNKQESDENITTYSPKQANAQYVGERQQVQKSPEIIHNSVSHVHKHHNESNTAKKQQSTYDNPNVVSQRGKQIITRFTNFMVEDGQMSALESSFSNNSDSKLFIIEYEDGATIGTYTINPSCKSDILGDLQTFQNFTQKFILSGNPKDIFVEKKGRVIKRGRQWIVTEKIKVSFK